MPGGSATSKRRRRRWRQTTIMAPKYLLSHSAEAETDGVLCAAAARRPPHSVLTDGKFLANMVGQWWGSLCFIPKRSKRYCRLLLIRIRCMQSNFLILRLLSYRKVWPNGIPSHTVVVLFGIYIPIHCPYTVYIKSDAVYFHLAGFESRHWAALIFFFARHGAPQNWAVETVATIFLTCKIKLMILWSLQFPGLFCFSFRAIKKILRSFTSLIYSGEEFGQFPQTTFSRFL